MSQIDPSENDVRIELLKLASQSLTGKPVGSIAMADEVIGVKKMPFMWNVRVWGWPRAIWWALLDWKARRKP